MKPFEVIDLAGAYLIGFEQEGNRKGDPRIMEVLQKLYFLNDDGSDFFDQNLLLQLFPLIDIDKDENTTPEIVYITVTTFLKLYFKSHPDKECEELINGLLEEDRKDSLHLFNKVLFNYYGCVYYNLLAWFMYEIGITLGLSNKDLSRWMDGDVNNFNRFNQIFREAKSLDANGYFFVKSYLDEFPDPFSNKIIKRVPLRLWDAMTLLRSLYFQRKPPYSYQYIKFEKRVEYKEMKEDSFAFFLLLLALGKKGHFKNNVEGFMIQSPDLDSPFVLYKDGRKILEDQELEGLLSKPLNGKEVEDSLLYGKDVYVEGKDDAK